MFKKKAVILLIEWVKLNGFEIFQTKFFTHVKITIDKNLINSLNHKIQRRVVVNSREENFSSLETASV